MRRYIIFIAALLYAGPAMAEDIKVEDIPKEEIARTIPKYWRIESIGPADTVSGWEKQSGSKGVRVTISRTPYDNKLHKTKSGKLAVYVPRFYLFVFPPDFVGRHVNGARLFKDGNVVTAKSPLAHRAMMIMEDFTAVGEWYVFHNNPSFKDWKSPVTDLIKAMKKALNKSL